MAKHGRTDDGDDLGRPSKIPRSRVRPLLLVLDLDHTLLHTAYYSLSPEESELMNRVYDLPYEEDDDFISWAPKSMISKLRPCVPSFLQQAAALGYKMCIYTMGTRGYAHFMAGILDPDGTYFGNRIFSRNDCTVSEKKGLDVIVPPGDESRVIIVDDTEEVWEDDRENLIHVQQFNYFNTSPGYKVRSLSECREREEEHSVLSDVLDVLTQARWMYFHNPDNQYRDVRVVLGEMKKQVLDGCKIMFNRFPFSSREGKKPIWMMAQEMGATCCSIKDVDDGDGEATHVVSSKFRSKAANWAKRNAKFLVHPLWIERSYYSWCRQEETEFALHYENCD